MPTYQYTCRDCGNDLEAVQKFTDDALTTCPACGHDALRKVYSAVGVQFKGSGFYRTDSRKASGSSAAGSSSDSSSGTSGPSSTKESSSPAKSSPTGKSSAS